MKKRCLSFLSVVCIYFLSTAAAYAQSADEVLRYGLSYPNQDPVSLVMPGASFGSGFGAYQQNPAAMALFDKSFFSFDLNTRYVTEDTDYLGNSSSFDNAQTTIADVGFVYNVPTKQGKLTIGGGYSKSHDFDRAYAGRGRNNLSTITDFYATFASADANQAAFDAFAIDDVQGDNRSLSILRFPVGSEYAGINQNFETIEEGVLGEYSAFIATEFFENIVFGASLGVISGSYRYEQEFLEQDLQNDYEGPFIDSDGDGEGDADIDRILVQESIDQTFTAFSARIGAMITPTEYLNIGLGYQFKNVLNIDENSDLNFETTLDNGDFFDSSLLREFNYEVVRPARLNAGITVHDISGFTASTSLEYVDYSAGRIRFDELQNSQTEDAENTFVNNTFKEVYNFRLGLQYTINQMVTPRIGFSYFPNPVEVAEDDELNRDRKFFSAGLSAGIAKGIEFNLGAQLGVWEDRVGLYSSPDVQESVVEDIRHWNVMGGISVGI